ncbi:septation regulator SpoVG [Texas Phoenix palm phytoplasma]|uniref:Septation regulator SpoVG n=1 Tax=Texas Phoenix palm phytoplasma TaxID=176709 RepID=A0ABS5BI69_9MOLU|nr:septation regulator SpoVG [Texas Phoenix palm phytoplasma]MBP3059280.1 septation regulator SpoVG [Texas Phoenix palm phytoplasma]
MQVTYVRINLHDTKSRLKGIASVTFDNCFVVHNIKIIQGEKNLFIAMPSVKNSKGDFLDIAHPINAETRKQIEKEIITSFNKKLEINKQEEKEVNDNNKNNVKENENYLKE